MDFTRDGPSRNFFEVPPAATCTDLGTGAFGNGFFGLTRGDLVVQDG